MSSRIVHRISCNPKSNLFFKCNLDSMRWLKYTHIGWEFQCFVSINGIINRNRYDLIKLGFIENNCIWKWNDQPICVGHVNVYTKSDHRGNWQKRDSWWWYGLRCVCVCDIKRSLIEAFVYLLSMAWDVIIKLIQLNGICGITSQAVNT